MFRQLILQLFLRLGLALALMGPLVPCAAEGVREIDHAWARLQPEGVPAIEGERDLGRRWDLDFPGLGGRALYRVVLPPRTRDDMALLFSRLGNQAEIRLNGVTLRRLGVLDDPTYDASKAPQLLQLPAALLKADGPNELMIEVSIQRQRWGGLSVMHYGPEAAVRPMFDRLQDWRQTSSTVFAASLAIMGGLATLLWWRQRDALYGVFALSAWLGMVRNIDQIQPEPWLPWPVWGALVAASYAAHLALICQFTLMALGRLTRAMTWGVWGVLGSAALLAAASFAWAEPLLWTLGLAALVPLGVVTVIIVAQEAWTSRRTIALVLAAAGVLAVVAGVHDLLWVRSVHSTGLRLTWMTHVVFCFALIMAGLVADRFSRSVAALRASSDELAARVRQREAELRSAFDALEVQQRQRAVAEERQRIMRELHDGVGAHLVGLMHLVQRPQVDRGEVEQLARTALDDMRVAVDSLQGAEGDLTTVLAMLRHRLEPRLKAAGLSLAWEMGDLPETDGLSPQSVLHVQRIVLEAVTNVIRHAQAHSVTIRAETDLLGAVVLSVVDDGIGPGRAEGGLGVRNMRSRAQALGAQLDIEPASPTGTRVRLRWARPATSSAAPHAP
ncbi:histidine kinase [Ideonella sp. 4Y11]|uniref:histidine kinase n=1 Tax=Ideonella aquatica TaxID=2824119 RepID=A0A940YJK4_9BURK|nr:ATP-binding protein [Ideonella aquatica]MBQ0957421.1 histidine kinase [Ideonella aquatica]